MSLSGCVLIQLCQLHFPKPNVSLSSTKKSGEEEVDHVQPHLELSLVIQVAAYFAAWLRSMLTSSDDDPLDKKLAFSYN